MVLEPLRDVGEDPVRHELADGVTDHALLLREVRVDVEEVVGVQVGHAATIAGGGTRVPPPVSRSPSAQLGMGTSGTCARPSSSWPSSSSCSGSRPAT